MNRGHWLVKFAPFRTPWEEIVARGAFTPRGIRSPEARKHLAEIKAEPRFDELALLRQPRLAVMPVSPEHFKMLLVMGES